MGGGISHHPETDHCFNPHFQVNDMNHGIFDSSRTHQFQNSLISGRIQSCYQGHMNNVLSRDENQIAADPDNMIEFFQILGNSGIDASENYQKCRELGIFTKEEFFMEIILNRAILDILKLSTVEIDNITKFCGELMASHRNHPLPFIVTPTAEMSSNDMVDEWTEHKPHFSFDNVPDQWINQQHIDNEVHLVEDDDGVHYAYSPTLNDDHHIHEITHWDIIIPSPRVEILNDGKSLHCDQSISVNPNPSIFLECHSPLTLITIRVEKDLSASPYSPESLILGILSETDVHDAHCSSCNPYAHHPWGDIESQHVKYLYNGVNHACEMYRSNLPINVKIPSDQNDCVELSLIIDRNSETCSFLWNGRMKYVFDVSYGLPAIGVSLSPGLVLTLTSDSSFLLDIWNSSPRPNLSLLPMLKDDDVLVAAAHHHHHHPSAYNYAHISEAVYLNNGIEYSSDREDWRNEQGLDDIDDDSTHVLSIPSADMDFSSSSSTLQSSSSRYIPSYSPPIYDNSSRSTSNLYHGQLQHDPSSSSIESLLLSFAPAPPIAMIHSQQQQAQSPNKQAKSPIQKNEDGDRLCCICLQRQKCVVLIPCRHLCLCEYCSDDCRDDLLLDCPLCREPIEHRLQVYI
jgi:hypothetical protein